MQYHLTDNITSNSIKGSAIFGVFSDKSTKALTGLVGKLDIAKITDTLKKSSFEGKINESLCIYDTTDKKLEKIYLVGLGDKDKYSEKSFLKVASSLSKLCKKEKLKNIYLALNTITNSEIKADWAIRNISIHVNGIDYHYDETKNKTKNKVSYKINKLIFVSTSITKTSKNNMFESLPKSQKWSPRSPKASIWVHCG